MMAQATMKAELVAVELYEDEALARAAWALAYANFFYEAESNGVPVSAGSLAIPQASMESAMTGLSTAGAAAIQSGITAFWAALLPALVFPGATVITPPPGLGGIAALLTSTFAANTSAKADKDAAMDAIATDLFNSSLGGTATFPGPVVAPVT